MKAAKIILPYNISTSCITNATLRLFVHLLRRATSTAHNTKNTTSINLQFSPCWTLNACKTLLAIIAFWKYTPTLIQAMPAWHDKPHYTVQTNLCKPNPVLEDWWPTSVHLCNFHLVTHFPFAALPPPISLHKNVWTTMGSAVPNRF